MEGLRAGSPALNEQLSPRGIGFRENAFTRDEEKSLPLVTDLDGTLVATDTLFEGILSLVRQSPAGILLLPLWLSRGKAFLKAEIARRFPLRAESLPYRADLIEYLREERAAGRRIVLATAAHETVARGVADHLGLFDEVLASCGSVNLKGARKRDELVKRFGIRGFDYAGDSAADAPVWAACRIGHIAGHLVRLPHSAVDAGATEGRNFGGVRAGLATWLRAVRVHQWVKNLLVFVPALLNHHLDLKILQSLTIAWLSFSLVASGTYVINDLFDLEADRRHRRKCRRPFASGEIPIAQGIAMALFLLSAGLLSGALVSTQLAACLLTYLGLTILYSLSLKGKPILDVVVLAVLYTLRVYSGGLVSRAYVSPWLFQFSIFLFLSLAFVKRYSELRYLRLRREPSAARRGYRLQDLSIISQAGVGSGLLAALVLALYVNGTEIERLYPNPQMLWGVCPLFAYWIIRVWLIAHRGNMHDDPILFAFRDRVSYIVGILITTAVLLGLTTRV